MKKLILLSLFCTACFSFAQAQFSGTINSNINTNVKNAPAGFSANIHQNIIDPAITNITFQQFMRNGARMLRITVELKNVGGANYVSAPNQQEVYLYEQPLGGTAKLLRRFAFQNLNGGASRQFVFERPDFPVGTEFPPMYRAIIAYDPDILLDGNPRNDDFRNTNNALTKEIKF